MKAFPAEEAIEWSRKLAGELRRTQVSGSDEEPAARLESLTRKLSDALGKLPGGQRAGYLAVLRDEFPAFAREAEPAAAPARPSPAPASAGGAALPPETLLARLVEAASHLSPETRAEFGLQLAAAGYTVTVAAAATSVPPNGPAGPSFDLPPEIRARLPLPPNQPVDAARALRFFGLLAEQMIALDQLAWSLWKQLAPNSTVRREAGYAGDFRKMAALYLSGDPETTSGQLGRLLEKTRKLIAGLLAGMGPAGSAFAQDFLARFSPDAIENRAGGGGFFGGGDQRNWRAYVEMFGQLTEQSIGQEVHGAIVQYAESSILGSNRPPAAPAAPRPQ